VLSSTAQLLKKGEKAFISPMSKIFFLRRKQMKTNIDCNNLKEDKGLMGWMIRTLLLNFVFATFLKANSE